MAIQFGVIGSGQWGTKVIHAIRGLGYDVKVCNRYGEFEGQKCATEYREFIPTVDIVWVATHPPLSCTIAREAVLQKKPTVVEKPVAFTSQEVVKLVRDSKAAQAPLIVDYIHLFCAKLMTLSKPIESLDMEIGGNGPDREYSDLWDYGSHALAITLNHIRSPLISATIARSIIESSEHESGNYRITLSFSGGEECRILTGNRFRQKTARAQALGLYTAEWNGHMWAYKLQTLISTIARLHLRGEYFTNGALAVEVTDLLERLHKLLPVEAPK